MKTARENISIDAEGKPCYQLHDYRGNVAVVVAASGKVLAHNRYYPYGEAITRFTGSHAAAQSNATATAARYSFGAKEHETMHGLNAYDFGPRLLSASLPVWDCPDRNQECYHPLSPYTYCAANPIRYTDPSGEVIVGSLSGQIDRLSTEAFKRSKKCDDEILKLIQQLSKPNLTITKIIKIMVKINTSVSKKNEFNAICSEIDQLKKSDQIYETRFTPQSSSDYTSTTIKNKTFEKDGVIILEMQDASYMSLAHELKHAYQFEIGEISFGSRALLYDQTDEVAAYKRESLFGGGSFNENDPMYKDLPKDPRSTKNIWNHNPSQEEIDKIRNRGCSFRLNGVTYLSTLARQTE